MRIKANDKRYAGILLPVSSLPSKYGIGDFGEGAYHFVDYLVECGQNIWQILPLGPTSFGDSPYQSFSAYAGNPYFIDIDKLTEEGLLTKNDVEGIYWGESDSKIDYSSIYINKFKVLRNAFSSFKEDSAYHDFYNENKYWLADYSLYMAVKGNFGNSSWLEWDDDIRLFEKSAIEKYKELLSEEIKFWCFIQFKFYEQWFKLKAYANKKGIKIFGDIPIYVAMDSADTWANYKLFLLDENHKPTVVAGCPPDYFSADGQLWGNSIYDWEYMEQNNFAWWKKRISFCSKIYDIIRIDHFIGIVRYYAIPAEDKNAINGEFHKGPGIKLIRAIDEARGETEIIAEDLGVVVDSVRRLVKCSGYPGMKIIQHAFNGDTTNEHLPFNYEKNMCIYLGTHDNDTMVAAIEKMPENNKEYLMKFLGKNSLDDIVWGLIRLAYSSVANYAIIQMQDILELDNSARMNLPSTVGGNWEWRVLKSQMKTEIASKLRELSITYGRQN